MNSSPITEKANPLHETLRWAHEYLRNAERTWTYREVGAQIMSALERVTTSKGSEYEERDAQTHLAYCLRLTKAVRQRDKSLEAVADSLEHLMRCIDGANDLTFSSVQDAVETVLLDVQFCISQHE